MTDQAICFYNAVECADQTYTRSLLELGDKLSQPVVGLSIGFFARNTKNVCHSRKSLKKDVTSHFLSNQE